MGPNAAAYELMRPKYRGRPPRSSEAEVVAHTAARAETAYSTDPNKIKNLGKTALNIDLFNNYGLSDYALLKDVPGELPINPDDQAVVLETSIPQNQYEQFAGPDLTKVEAGQPGYANAQHVQQDRQVFPG